MGEGFPLTLMFRPESQLLRSLRISRTAVVHTFEVCPVIL
jgi:hypothetical protein